ncbi:MAG TPA: DUF1559 domain-containing protein [Tepidisphaeraceae bacterium]|nr:DUF1559 domain-containing protein [Tepidisphaeraceae bacterium]
MKNRRRPSAFTLVELLVVIGIIALLISILLPVLNRVREQAKQTKCASNIHQIFLAVQMYADEHKGFYPIAPLIGEQSPANDFMTYTMLPDNSGAGKINYAAGALWQYLGGAAKVDTIDAEQGSDHSARYALFNCPSDSDNPRLVRWGNMEVIERNFTYSFNALMREKPTQSGWVEGVTTSMVVNSSQKVLVIEEAWPNDGCCFLAYVDPNNPGTAQNPNIDRDEDDVLAARHVHKGNQGFADGHVEAISPKDLGFDTENVTLNDSRIPVVNNPYQAARYFDLFFGG